MFLRKFGKGPDTWRRQKDGRRLYKHRDVSAEESSLAGMDTF